MLALVGCVIFSGIYFILVRAETKTNLDLLVGILDGTRRIVGTIATVTAVFVLIELVMWWASDLDWANQGLLTIERTLSQVRFALSLKVTSSYFLLGIVVVFFLSIYFPFICVLSGIARRLPAVTKGLIRANNVLVLVTSLTFFGTGTFDGLAKLEAILIENRRKVERGLENAEDLGRQIAAQAVEDAISEIIAEDEIQQEIAELINYTAIIAEYPYITWSQMWKLTFDEPLSNDSKLSMWQVAKAKSAQASVNSFIQSISEFEATPTSNRTVPLEKLKTLMPDATLDQVQHVQTELERFVAPESSPKLPDPATKIDEAFRLSFSLIFDQAVHLLLSSTGGESALYDIFNLFRGETIDSPLKKQMNAATTQYIEDVFAEDITPAEAYSRVKQEVKSNVQSLYEQKFKPRINSIIARLREERTTIENLVYEKSNALSHASKKALADQVQKMEMKLEEYDKESSPNPDTKSECEALLEKSIGELFPNTSSALKLKDFKEFSPNTSPKLELVALLEKFSKKSPSQTLPEFGQFRDEKLLNSSSGVEILDQLRIYEAQQVRLSPKAPILTRIEILKMIVRRIRIP